MTGDAGRLRVPSWLRVGAMALATMLHLGLLLWLLLPARPWADHPVFKPDALPPMTLRLSTLPGTVSLTSGSMLPHVSAAKTRIRKPGIVAAAAPGMGKGQGRQPGQRDGQMALSPAPGGAGATVPQTLALDLPVGVDGTANSSMHLADGGFRRRLLDAVHSNAMRAVPGTDVHIVAGLTLNDPMHHGFASAMRNTQRLFGITSRHCIDVQLEASLTPQQLLARHLTMAEVTAEEQKYDCNRPMGLSF